MTNLPALPDDSILNLMATAPDMRERVNHVRLGMELVQDVRFTRPVPRFMVDLPWVGDDEDVQYRIAAQLFLADDPDKVDDGPATRASKDITGKSVEVNAVLTNETDMDKGWGAYLLVHCTDLDTGETFVASTGAPQAIIRLAIGYARGEFPLKGAFAGVAGTGRNGNPVVTFIAEPDL